jgi:hypothetical protein
MRMAVDETGKNRASFEIDPARAGASERKDVLRRTDGNNLAILDRDRFDHRVAGIDRVNPSAMKDSVGMGHSSNFAWAEVEDDAARPIPSAWLLLDHGIIYEINIFYETN